MPDKLSYPESEEREMRRLRDGLLQRGTDEDAEHVCVRCGCTFRSMNGSIACPFCGLEYVPNIK